MAMIPEDIKKARSRWETIEIIAACLREEGIKAVAKQEMTEYPNKIEVIRPRTLQVNDKPVQAPEVTHTIFWGSFDRDEHWHDTGFLALYKGRHRTAWDPPIVEVEIGDPDCFPKLKKALA